MFTFSYVFLKSLTLSFISPFLISIPFIRASTPLLNSPVFILVVSPFLFLCSTENRFIIFRFFPSINRFIFGELNTMLFITNLRKKIDFSQFTLISVEGTNNISPLGLKTDIFLIIILPLY